MQCKSLPNEASLRSVDEMPAVGIIVFPTDILGVMPQSAHLNDGIVKPFIILSTKTDSTTLKWEFIGQFIVSNGT